mmetsp:Transcript_32277/g.53952  ORF Transcript_32277/g.53952 Transcript_32277/m.53952 type:complete len:257 (+) Transcript_32277:41-811(+)
MLKNALKLSKVRLYCWILLARTCFTVATISHGKPTAYNYGPISHIPISKHLWSTLIKPGDTVIDATCGNGNDSLYLAKLALTPISGRIYCIDIQSQAVENTRERFLEDSSLEPLVDNRITLITGSHEVFPLEIQPSTVALICYNLGYLPGKQRKARDAGFEEGEVTSAKTTIASLKRALPLLKEGGMLSVVAYRGHEGAEEELQEVQTFLSQLPMQDWRVYANSAPLNRPLSPTLFNAFKIEKFGYIPQKILNKPK